MRAEKEREAHLDFDGQRNDVVLVQLDHAIRIDLVRSVLARASIGRKVLRIGGGLLAQPLEQPSHYFRFVDQRVEGLPVRLLDVWDEGRGIREELGL